MAVPCICHWVSTLALCVCSHSAIVRSVGMYICAFMTIFFCLVRSLLEKNLRPLRLDYIYPFARIMVNKESQGAPLYACISYMVGHDDCIWPRLPIANLGKRWFIAPRVLYFGASLYISNAI